MKLGQRQRGSVLIIVLWTAVLLTILVTAMAAKVRLSAQTVMHNYAASAGWAQVMSAMNFAEAELQMRFMARPVGEIQPTDDEGAVREEDFRFNGQALELAYPLPEGVTVRIYNHSGKINLNRIPRRMMQLLIENRLGGVEEADPQEVAELLDAWGDWTDLNELAFLNGAEAEYYQSLDPPYSPRNNAQLDTVEELLHIRGFAELFEGVNLEAAFTVHGNRQGVNLNLATREAMQLLPGMTDELIELVLAYRERRDLNTRGDIAEIIPFENLQELSAWISTNVSDYFSIYAYHQINEEEVAAMRELSEDEYFNPDPVAQAYMEVVQVRNFNEPRRVMKIDPYGRLPDTSPPRVEPSELPFIL